MKTKPVSDENLRDVEQMIVPPEKKVIKRMKTSTVKSDTIKCLSDYTIQLYKGLWQKNVSKSMIYQVISILLTII